PQYTQETFRDLFFGFLVAIVAGLLAVLIREFGEQVSAVAAKHRAAVLVAVALLTGVIAVVVTNVGDVGVNLILFSGENGMGDLLAQTSLATVLLVVVGKALAYALALGGGFRGGPIFPATYLGVGVGLAASLLINDLSVSPMAAAAIAASVTVLLRLPFTSALLAMLLIGSAGPAVAPFAIIGAVIGFGMRQALDRFDAKRQAGVDVKGEVVHGS
ncbi:MAG: chloride channel protein, partial [bacterium]|nr:chloride channel protein [bacterium]